MREPAAVRTLPALLLLALPAAAEAQQEARCRFVCAPEVTFEPAVTVVNVFAAPRVVELGTEGTADTVRLERDAVVEWAVVVAVPTAIPRIGLSLQALWTPFENRNRNLYTGRTARQLDEEGVADNSVSLAAEINVTLLDREQTGGWIAAHLNLVDEFSPAARPEDDGLYTHKLGWGVDASVKVFREVESEWLRRVLVWGALDYVATGLPGAGDEVPDGRQIFLDDASPWSFSALVSLPLAPL